jgi:MoaA/NifB/PqqE/SkfB family radical SAM enzyme
MNKINLAKDFLCAKLFGMKKPLAVSWDLTYRCNFNCKYCKIPDSVYTDELSTERVCDVIEQLSRLGTRRIHFGGGEVLLRDDLGEILSVCRKKRISTVVLTNGFLVSEKIDAIRDADQIQISFDGNEQVHDQWRQRGSYKKVLQAIEVVSQNKLNVALSTTLHTDNLQQIDFILRFSHERNIPVKFQLVNEFLAGERDVSSLKLSDTQRYNAMEILMKEKKNNPLIINSMAALRYMRDYHRSRRISCCTGVIFARISVDGSLFACKMSEALLPNYNIENRFRSLVNVSCKQCLCTPTLELNLIYSLDAEAIMNAMSKFLFLRK